MTDVAPSGPPPAVHVPALVSQYGPEVERALEGLTAKERRFVEEYPIDLQGGPAAVRAGYSKNSSRQIAYEMLRKPKIVDAIAAVMAGRSQATAISRSWVLAELADVHSKAKAKDSATAMTARLKALELIGRHVDVRAFRAGFGFAPNDNDGDASDIWDLSLLSDEEFDTFERLLAKVTVIKTRPGGEGAPQPGEGPAAAGGASGGNQGDV